VVEFRKINLKIRETRQRKLFIRTVWNHQRVSTRNLLILTAEGSSVTYLTADNSVLSWGPVYSDITVPKFLGTLMPLLSMLDIKHFFEESVCFWQTDRMKILKRQRSTKLWQLDLTFYVPWKLFKTVL